MIGILSGVFSGTVFSGTILVEQFSSYECCEQSGVRLLHTHETSLLLRAREIFSFWKNVHEGYLLGEIRQGNTS